MPSPGDGAGPALYIVEHSIDATVVGLSIGRRLVPEDALQELGTGLFLQDIGKLALPPSLVHKPGPLAPDEWELMMQHPLLGLEFLRGDTISAQAKSVVRSHHERWDGSGYPSGLVGRRDPDASRASPPWQTSSTPSRASATTRRPLPRARGHRADPRRVGHRVRPRGRRGLPRRGARLVEQVERGTDDRLRVDLVVAVDVVEIARLAEAGDAERRERHGVYRRRGRRARSGPRRAP